MAKPRIFISSTFYDLKYVREVIERFIRDLGYEPVLFEKGAVPYGSREALEEYCYKEIQLCDILISIVGGRYGSESSEGNYSITQKEIRKAYDLGKQIYIFVEKNVKAEYETYTINKDIEMKFKHVDNKKVYEFIDELQGLPKNNSIFEFNSPQEIVKMLKEQFAGLFQRLLHEEAEKQQIDLVQSLRSTVKTLQQLVTLESKRHEDQNESINNILTMNHPSILAIKKILGIKYRILFSNVNELNELFISFGYKRFENKSQDVYLQWVKTFDDLFTNNSEEHIKVSKDIFDENEKLVLDLEWDDSYIHVETKYYAQSIIDISDDDLPF